MSDTEDIFADNSSDDFHSTSSVQAPEESVIIEETESEEEEEEEDDDEEERLMKERLKKRQSRRMSFHPQRASSPSSGSGSSSSGSSSSGSEDEEDDKSVRKSLLDEEAEVTIASDDDSSEEERVAEARALSPATRLSISGIRPDDLTSDDDEEDEIVIKRKVKRNVLISDDESEEEGQEEEKQEQEVEVVMPKVEVEEAKGDSFDESLPMRSFDPESVTSGRSSISTKLSSTVVSEEPDEELSVSGRLSTSVRQSIGNKLSSTALDVEFNSVEKSEVLSVSSDDEDSPAPAPPFVQPTIKAAFTKKQVSQSFYDGKMRQLEETKKSLSKMEQLMKIKNDLPDKGVALQKRMDVIRQDVKNLTAEVNAMEVDGSKGVRNEIRKSFESTTEASGHISIDSANTSRASNQSVNDGANNQPINISWDEIKKQADQIQPKYTGKQGIATFETQKTLTMDRLATLHKSIETCPTEDMHAEPPKLLKIELMDHQKHALAWMMWRENQRPRGGILADDMGLGKTLSMISLILKVAELDDPDKEPEESSSDEDDQDAGSGWKAKGRKDYYAGGTIIVCPASLMRQWEGEIKNRVSRNSLAVNVYHGTNRDVKPRHLAKYDVVITTYNIVSREAKSSGGGIFGVDWERIILDEAHMIRNHKSAMSIACCQLKSRRRWVLTGTPIQNKEMDMYALLKFLRCTPFDDLNHWKKWIDNKSAGGLARLHTITKSLMLRRTKQQLNEKGALNCLPEKNIEVVEVQLDKDEMNVYQKVLLYSRTLFAQFLHQRTEKENDAFYGMQGSRPTYAQIRQPNGAYDRVHQKLKQLHNKDEVKQHQILVLLLRLRQICCHPGLIQQMLQDDDGNFDVSMEEEEPELDLLEQLNKLKLTDTSGTGLPNDSSSGPLRELNISDHTPEAADAITKASSKVMLRSNPVFDLNRASSKIARLVALLEEKILKGDDKAVIVSQWTNVLDIVAQHLHLKRVRYCSLTGKVPVKFRNDIVTDFNKQGTGPKIMLLSLTAGGVGLNLVGANHLLLLDLHWNPQLEAQAQDRVYRVGQKKTVHIWKFMCTDTVEQAIQVLQQKKIGIANEVLTGTKHTGSKLTIDDLKSLFGL